MVDVNIIFDIKKNKGEEFKEENSIEDKSIEVSFRSKWNWTIPSYVNTMLLASTTLSVDLTSSSGWTSAQ